MNSFLSKIFIKRKNPSVFEKRVGFYFTNPELLKRAFTHPSTLNVNPVPYERLEFLGDAVLDLVASEYLYKKFPDEKEGQLTKKRMKYVNGHYLYRVAETLNLEDDCIVDKSVDMENLPTRKKILAEILESVIGAMYLDKGLKKTSNFIINWVMENKEIDNSARKINYKGNLIEYCQKNKITDIDFRIIKVSGPDHKRKYRIGLFLNGKKYGSATSTTKKSAEQMAAKKTLEKIQSLPGPDPEF